MSSYGQQKKKNDYSAASCNCWPLGQVGLHKDTTLCIMYLFIYVHIHMYTIYRCAYLAIHSSGVFIIHAYRVQRIYYRVTFNADFYALHIMLFFILNFTIINVEKGFDLYHKLLYFTPCA